jgi:hypothetical protein
VQLGPGVDIEIGCHGHHRADRRHAFGDQHRKHATPGITDQNELPHLPLCCDARDRDCQRIDHTRSIASDRPIAGITARLQTVITRATQIERGLRVGLQQVEYQRLCRRRILSDATRRHKRAPVAVQVDMQPPARRAFIRTDKRTQAERSRLQLPGGQPTFLSGYLERPVGRTRAADQNRA